MEAVISIVLACLIAGPLGGALKKHPWAFYAAGLVIAVVFCAYRWAGLYLPALSSLASTVQKGQLALALLFIVMFAGALEPSSKLRRHLMPLRAELSILSFTLVIGHVVGYAPAYILRLGGIVASHPLVFASMVVALIATIVYLLLTVTSFPKVKGSMEARAWKRLQRLAYVMMALLFGHILLALLTSALLGSVQTIATIGIYAALFAAYLIMRMRRAILDAGSRG